MLKVSSQKLRAELFCISAILLLLVAVPSLSQQNTTPSGLKNYHPDNSKRLKISKSDKNNFILNNLPILLLMQLQDIELDTLARKKEVYTPVFMKQQPIRRVDINKSREANFNNTPPPKFRQAMSLDTNLQYLQSNYYVDSSLINDPYIIDTDDYLQIRKQYLVNEIRDSLSNSYDLKKALTGNDINKMLSAATGLTIPMPPNPVLNLFGKPTININVQGELNLRMGWRWDSQNLGSVSQFGQSQSSPVFNQDIKLIISGGIGDKLRLSTDWNTRKMRDYDNKFKIGYEGEDDEIIKLIEVGNVTLPTQSTLISGSEALFGIRADFQFGPLYLKTIASQ